MSSFADKVVYQIYPKSFCDSNGDGIGDIPGIISKLDYLQQLGIDYIWTTPFFRSPQNDNGYDIADYCAIEPMFGTLEDVDRLIEEAGKRGIGMMFDMVFNHTSTEHEWFQKALAGDEKYQNYYIFKEGTPDQLPTNWESKFGGPAWEYVPSLGKWYLHLFDVTQADLNWENPEVREELKKVIRFWKDRGVKGFRFDVVNLISKPAVFEDDHEGDGRRFYTDGRHVHEFLQELVADTGIADMITVGEMSSTSIDNCIRYSNPDCRELAMAFSFHHLKVDYKNGNKWELMPANLMQLKKLFEDWQVGMQEGGGWNAVFWDNHDQPRIVSRLGDDGRYWKESAKMLGAVVHGMRGTPYIYQGDEIGMTNAHFHSIEQYRDVESTNYYRILMNEGKTSEEALHIIAERSRDNGRTPMQWDASPRAGFCAPEGAAPWLEVPDYRRDANAAAEVGDPDSIFSFYQQLIRLRKQEALIAEGKIRFLAKNNAAVIAYERYSEQENDRILIYANMTAEEVSAEADLAGRKASVIMGNYADAAANEEASALTLRPYECLIIRLS